MVPGRDRNQEGERPGLHRSRVLPYQALPGGAPRLRRKCSPLRECSVRTKGSVRVTEETLGEHSVHRGHSCRGDREGAQGFPRGKRWDASRGTAGRALPGMGSKASRLLCTGADSALRVSRGEMGVCR